MSFVVNLQTASLVVSNNTKNYIFSGPGLLTNAGGFTKLGAAKLTYKGTGLHQLTGSGANYQIGGGSVTIDGSAGLAANGTGQFWVGTTTAGGAALSLTNAVVTNSSWLAVARGTGPGGYTSTATLNNSYLVCTNISLGYANGINGNNELAMLTLTGNSKLANGGVFNLSESTGSSCSVVINDNSWIYSLSRVLIGQSANATGTVVIANSGTFTNGGYVSIGAAGVGSVTLKNNAVWQAPTDFNIADTANSQGTLNIQDNATLIVSTLYLAKAANTTGTIYQTGGSILSRGGNEWRIGGNTSGAANQVGIYYLSNGVLNANNNFQVGAYGTGYLYQSGGTATIGGWASIARFAGSIGYLNISGGAFNQTGTGVSLIIGEQGNGTFNLSGGLVTCAGNLVIGNNAGAVGTVNLNGRKISAKSVVMNDAGASSSIAFNGGILQAAPGANASFMGGINTATVQSGGAVFDSGTNAITISQDLLDGGGALTKPGSGSLTLAGNLYYSGGTSVGNGTLLVSAPTTFASPGCAVSSGAAFGVKIAAVNGQLTVPTLSLAAAGSGLSFNFAGLGGQTNAPLFVNLFAANGPVTVSISGFNFVTGQFPLVQYTSRTGTVALHLALFLPEWWHNS